MIIIDCKDLNSSGQLHYKHKNHDQITNIKTMIRFRFSANRISHMNSKKVYYKK